MTKSAALVRRVSTRPPEIPATPADQDAEHQGPSRSETGDAERQSCAVEKARPHVAAKQIGAERKPERRFDGGRSAGAEQLDGCRSRLVPRVAARQPVGQDAADRRRACASDPPASTRRGRIGGARMKPGCWVAGSWGARTGAASVSAGDRQEQPPAKRISAAPRQESGSRRGSASRKRQVGREHAHREQRRDGERAAGHEIQIPRSERFVHQRAEAGPRHHHFHGEGAAEHRRRRSRRRPTAAARATGGRRVSRAGGLRRGRGPWRRGSTAAASASRIDGGLQPLERRGQRQHQRQRRQDEIAGRVEDARQRRSAPDRKASDGQPSGHRGKQQQAVRRQQRRHTTAARPRRRRRRTLRRRRRGGRRSASRCRRRAPWRAPARAAENQRVDRALATSGATGR